MAADDFKQLADSLHVDYVDNHNISDIAQSYGYKNTFI